MTYLEMVRIGKLADRICQKHGASVCITHWHRGRTVCVDIQVMRFGKFTDPKPVHDVTFDAACELLNNEIARGEPVDVSKLDLTGVLLPA